MVPDYLQGRPKETILHCLHRQAASKKFVREDICMFTWTILKSKGKRDRIGVNFGDQSHDPHCTCRDWLTFYVPCTLFCNILSFSSLELGKTTTHHLTSPYLRQIVSYCGVCQWNPKKFSRVQHYPGRHIAGSYPESNYTEFLGRFITTHLCYQNILRVVAR